MELPKLVAVVGPNASGKSSVGIELARRFGGEIVSADSRQVYRGFDLCCGRVTAEEARTVPHHLLGIRDIREAFSVADYQAAAYSVITEILGRGKTPFIVGGTGLYVGSVVRGYVLPDGAADASAREELASLPLDGLRALLTPEGAAFLDANPSDAKNKRRVIRVIEKTSQGLPLRYENAPRYDTLLLGAAWRKERLHARIDERLDARIRDGMIDEVREYLDNGGSQERLYSLGLEYRHILFYLTGKYKSLDEFKTELSRAIKRFAKRQTTWFRRDKAIRWLDMEADYMGQARSLTADFLGASPAQ
jgi:tRNA dimethylallyltransferase